MCTWAHKYNMYKVQIVISNLSECSICTLLCFDLDHVLPEMNERHDLNGRLEQPLETDDIRPNLHSKQDSDGFRSSVACAMKSVFTLYCTK